MKSDDIEGNFELYFTRLPGYLWAVFFDKLNVHPIVVTLVSIILGTLSGVCFYFEDLKMTLLGIFLLIWANWYDCADGQLARMAKKGTLIGRILDGFAGDVWFFSIYFFICLRYTYPTPTAWCPWIWFICAWSGFRCHARQCSIADYYRNIHLWVEKGQAKCELDNAVDLRQRFQQLGWNLKEWFEKLYLFFYISYTVGQEDQSPKFQQLRAKVNTLPEQALPDNLRQEFRHRSKKLMFSCQILTFDERFGVLALSLLLGIPWLWPILELSLFEILRYRTIRQHEKICEDMMVRLEA